MKTCRRCVLPGDGPDLSLDATGLCPLCRAEQASKRPTPPAEADLVKLLGKHKGKGEHDCLMLCSGGADSLAALHLAVRRFKVRPLVVTIDQGFAAAGALENVERAAARLDVDWLATRTVDAWPLYRQVLESRSPAPLGALTALVTTALACRTAERFELDLLLTGATPGQPSQPGGAAGLLAAATPLPSIGKAIFDALDAGRRLSKRLEDLPRSTEELRKKYKKKQLISPFTWVPLPAADRQRLAEELGWKPLPGGVPHGSASCRLDPLATFLAVRRHGLSHHHLEVAARVRAGDLPREPALADLAPAWDQDPLHPAIQAGLDLLGVDARVLPTPPGA